MLAVLRLAVVLNLLVALAIGAALSPAPGEACGCARSHERAAASPNEHSCCPGSAPAPAPESAPRDDCRCGAPPPARDLSTPPSPAADPLPPAPVATSETVVRWVPPARVAGAASLREEADPDPPRYLRFHVLTI